MILLRIDPALYSIQFRNVRYFEISNVHWNVNKYVERNDVSRWIEIILSRLRLDGRNIPGTLRITKNEHKTEQKFQWKLNIHFLAIYIPISEKLFELFRKNFDFYVSRYFQIICVPRLYTFPYSISPTTSKLVVSTLEHVNGLPWLLFAGWRCALWRYVEINIDSVCKNSNELEQPKPRRD